MDSTRTILEALPYIPADDYSTWINVGMALKYEGLPLNTWRAWSETSPKSQTVKEEEWAKKWDSFKSETEKPVTGGTIVAMAKEHGYDPKAADEPIPFDYRLTEEDERKAHIMAFGGTMDDVPRTESGFSRPKFEEPKEWNPVHDMLTFLDRCFNPDEIVSFQEGYYDEKKGKWTPGKKENRMTAGSMIDRLKGNYQKFVDGGGDIHDENKLADVITGVIPLNPKSRFGGVWVRMNPIDPKRDPTHTTPTNKMVTDYRFALLESDDMPLEEQVSFLRKSELPITVMTFSGGKSVHALVRIDAFDEKDYRSKVNRLHEWCRKNGFKPDEKTKNPARLTRFPGCYRGEPSARHKQFIVDTNLGKSTFKEWEEWQRVNANIPISTPKTEKPAIPFIKRIENFKKNDSENADRLAALCAGKFLYCVDLKTWLKYDGRKWDRVEPVELQEPARLAIQKELVDIVVANAAYVKGGGELKEGDLKAYNSIIAYLNGAAQNRIYIDNAIKLAQGVPSMMCHAGDFDNDPYLLNCANGVLNLKTFEFMPHSPKQMFMKCTRAAYNPVAHSTLWRDTMRQIVPDNNTYDYVQRMAGYCLTGDCSEELLFFLYGHGGTGKGTFTETLGYALGDYSTSVPVEILLSSKWEKGGNSPSPYIAGLKGTRLAFSSESGIGNYFDEATLKYLTGGDTITGRFLHSNPVEFSPSHKLVISSNYMPAIRDATDDGVKRRLVIIPFNADIKKRDAALKNKLHTPENLSDCLLWAVEGCRKWQAVGLGEGTFSQEIGNTIKGYYDENDTIAQFVEANCKFGPNEETSGAQLYKEFKRFADENEAYEMTRRRFTQAMEKKYGAQIKRGFVQGGRDRGFKGIGLKYNPYEQSV